MMTFQGKVTVPLGSTYKQAQLTGYTVAVRYKVPRAVLPEAEEQNSAPPRKQIKFG